MRIGAFALGKCGVEQDIDVVVVSKQVRIAVPPLAVGLSKLGERRLSTLIHQSSRSIDEIFDLLCLVGWRRPSCVVALRRTTEALLDSTRPPGTITDQSVDRLLVENIVSDWQ
jgi:hypothetical protein